MGTAGERQNEAMTDGANTLEEEMQLTGLEAKHAD